MIGQGCYGAVYLGELVRKDGSSENVAVKMMKDKEAIPEKDQMDFQQEFEILQVHRSTLQSSQHQNMIFVDTIIITLLLNIAELMSPKYCRGERCGERSRFVTCHGIFTNGFPPRLL